MVIFKKYKEYLFVDGYNIINFWEELKEKANISFEEARLALQEELFEYQNYSKTKVILVYDAHMVKGNTGTEDDYKGLSIFYTKENETADQFIERVIDTMGKYKKIRVATSDFAEQQLIFSRGAMRLSARELKEEIEKSKQEANRIINRQKTKNKNILSSIKDEQKIKLEKFKNKLDE